MVNGYYSGIDFRFITQWTASPSICLLGLAVLASASPVVTNWWQIHVVKGAEFSIPAVRLRRNDAAWRQVRLKANPGRIGILGNETDGSESSSRASEFLDGDDSSSEASLERSKPRAYAMISVTLWPCRRSSRRSDLLPTEWKLTGVYSLSTSNTSSLLSVQPVLHFLIRLAVVS